MRLSTIRNKKLLFQGILFVLLPLLIGAVIYFLLCPNVIFVRMIGQLVLFEDSIALIRTDSLIVRFVRNYVLDFLWAFSFASLIAIIFHYESDSFIRIILLVPFFVGLVLEYLQRWEIVIGTYDPWDIVAEGVSVLAAMYISICSRRDNNEKDKKD